MQSAVRTAVRRIAALPAVESLASHYASLGVLRDRRLAVLAGANFLDTMSVSLVVPLLPTYAESLGAGAFLVGVIFAAESAARALLSTPMGYLTDRFNRRVPIAVGTAASGLAVAAFGLVSVPLLFVGLRLADGAATALRGPATTAYVGDAVPESERGSALGAYRTVGMLGLAVGPAAGGLLAAATSPAVPFVVLGAGTLLAGVGLAVLLPPVQSDDHGDDTDADDTAAAGGTDDADEPVDGGATGGSGDDTDADDTAAAGGTDDADEPVDGGATGGSGDAADAGVAAGSRWSRSWNRFRRTATVPMVALGVSVFASQIGTGAFNPLLPLLLEATVAAGPAYTGLAWSTFGVAMFLLTPVGGSLADRAGRKRTLLAGKVSWGVVAVGLAVATTPLVPVALLFLGGVASAFSGPALGALQYEVAPDGREGTVVGGYQSVAAAGVALGPILGGFAADHVGVRAVFVGMGVLWALDTLTVGFGVRETRTDDAESG